MPEAAAGAWASWEPAMAVGTEWGWGEAAALLCLRREWPEPGGFSFLGCGGALYTGRSTLMVLEGMKAELMQLYLLEKLNAFL